MDRLTSELTPEVLEHIKRLVDAAPPLRSDQLSRLGVLLNPAPMPAEHSKAA